MVNRCFTCDCLITEQVQLDAMDVAGDNQLNLEHDIVKQRLTSKGVAVGEPGIEVVGDVSIAMLMYGVLSHRLLSYILNLIAIWCTPVYLCVFMCTISGK